MKIISKEAFDRIPADYKSGWDACYNPAPEYLNRRCAFLPGEGTTLFTEGIHFLVDGDYSHLPPLEKANAKVGACYQMPGGYIEVTKVYRLSEEEAREHELYYLDRADFIQHADWGTVPGGCALPGSDVSEYYKNN